MSGQLITKKDLNKVFWRSLALQGCFNYERMQAIGFAYSMIPVLRKLYPNKDDMTEALQRHLSFFNTSPQFVTFINGSTIALEEMNANNHEEFDTGSINATKAALMGPLAGIGDSFFWGTFRIIGAGIGTALALEGNILGTILFILIYNVPHYLIRYFGIHIGYNQGLNFLSEAVETGAVQNITKAAKILGTVVVGAMIASMVRVSTPLVFDFGGSEFAVQSIFDGILPKILPLGLTFLLYYLVKKGYKTTTLMMILILVAIVGVYIKIF